MLRFNTSTLLPLLFYLHPIFYCNAAESSFYSRKHQELSSMNEQYLQALSLYQRLVLSLSNLRLIHTSNANANAGASTSKHSCELPRRKKMENFHFLSLAFALVFAIYTCEPGQCKGKRTV